MPNRDKKSSAFLLSLSLLLASSIPVFAAPQIGARGRTGPQGPRALPPLRLKVGTAVSPAAKAPDTFSLAKPNGGLPLAQAKAAPAAVAALQSRLSASASSDGDKAKQPRSRVASFVSAVKQALAPGASSWNSVFDLSKAPQDAGDSSPRADRPGTPRPSGLIPRKTKEPSLGIDTSAMDLTVRPQDDFFRYVSGSWLKTFEIPADKSRFGVFDQLHDNSEAAVKAIIEEASVSENAPGSDKQRIADIYKSYMDEALIETRGLAPIAGDLAAIHDIRSKDELPAVFARAATEGIGIPVSLDVDQDSKNTAAYIAQLSQSGLGLPERDYYFKDDEQSAKIRAKYLEYITSLLSLAGEDDAPAKAAQVFALEKALAEHQWTPVQRRDRDKTYNKVAIKDLGGLAPGFDWSAYLRGAGVRPEETDLVVAEPSYLAGLVKVLAEQPLESWKLYMTVRTLSSAAEYLPKAFVDARFEYYGRTLQGTLEMKPRWKRGVDLVNGAIGESIGKIYVQKHFPESSKKTMERIVENLRAAYAERIKGLAWMGEATKQKALEKLRKFTPKIGYPNQWRDYSGLKVSAGELLGNVRRSNKLDFARMIGKLGKPVDRDEWHMTPQTVNAYYNPSMNDIVFPAAILQAPFFDPAADDAVNYGAIGGVIGHEMSHGFDDQGAKSDGDGMLKDWWTKEDEAAFEARTGKLADQYDAFEPLPGKHVNGKLTLGENIGDLGGLTVAYHAYRLALNGVTAPILAGFTGDQRFFLGWGQVWRLAIRDAALSLALATDPHSPAQYRVNGVVRNMPEFYGAYGVKEKDGLFLPEKDRVGIW